MNDKANSLSWLNPRDLCLSGRFDIFIKYLYARALVNGMPSEFHKRAYHDHLRVLNGHVELDEYGKPCKVGRARFLQEFENVVRSIESDGFSTAHPVPISANGSIMNGAHRVAACMALNRPIYVQQHREPFEPRWTYDFFRSSGLHPDYLDAGGLAAADWYDDCRVAVIFGAGFHARQEILEELRSIGKVWYQTAFPVSERAQLNLIRVIYEGEPWLGRREFGYLGAAGKARPCFPPDCPQEVCFAFFVPGADADAIRQAKERIRSQIGKANHSLHMTDSRDETLRIAEIVLNENGRHFLTHRRYGRFRAFERDLHTLQAGVAGHPQLLEHICVVGSSVLAAYGLRDARDLDIVFSNCRPDLASNIKFESSNAHWTQYGFDVDSLVQDPRHHFRCNGVKFVSLETVVKLKAIRRERKDAVDLALVDAMVGNPRSDGKATIARLALVLRLYCNAKWLRSYAGHWLARLGLRVQRKARRKANV